MLLHFRLLQSNLSGEPREYAPRLAVWSTERRRMPGAAAGMAVRMVPLSEQSLRGTESVRLADEREELPTDLDEDAELCVALYASTRTNGYSDALAPRDRPNTIRAGQVNLHWFGLLKHLADSGKGRIRVRAPVMSAAGYDGVLYEHQFAQQSAEEDYAIISAVAERAATRAELEIMLEPVSDAAYRRVLETASDAKRQSRHERLLEDEQTYERSIERYLDQYYRLFPRDGSGRLFVPAAAESGLRGDVVFAPDTPSMERFHLPMWSTGVDRMPFAEWWFETLNRGHRSDASTEKFFSHLAQAGLARAQTDADEVVRTVGVAFGRGTPPGKRARYAQHETPERAALLRSVEATYYACTSMALSFHYTSDGRYVVADGRRVERVQVEDPEQDSVSGASRSGDCEDLEKVIAICAHLLGEGRSDRAERDWDDRLLSAMRTVTQHYTTLHTFGSVRGAQLSDAPASAGGAAVKFPSDQLFSDAARGPRFSRLLPLEPDTREERMRLTVNPRLYWRRQLKQARPQHWHLWEQFKRREPELADAMWQAMPATDYTDAWGHLSQRLDTYLSVRLRLVVEAIEERHNIEVVYSSPVESYVTVYRRDDADDGGMLYTMQYFLDTYNDGLPLMETPALRVEELDDLRGAFGADVWSGEYRRYPMHYQMMDLFPLAAAFLQWYSEREKRTPMLNVSFHATAPGAPDDVVRMSVTETWLLDTFKSMLDDTKRYGALQSDRTPMTIMAQIPHSNAHHHYHHSGQLYPPVEAPNDESARQLSDEAVRFVDAHKSVSELHRAMKGDVKREARNRPRAFWRYVLTSYYDRWKDRFARLFAAFAAHDLDDDMMRHIAARETQYGAYEMWRNACLWVEWYTRTLEDPGLASRALWFGMGRESQHAALDKMFDQRGPDIAPINRLYEARKIAQTLLDVTALADHLWSALDARFVKHVYRHAAKALGVLGVAPKAFSNAREKDTLSGQERCRFQFPRPPVSGSASELEGPSRSSVCRHRAFVTAPKRHADLLGIVRELTAHETSLHKAVAALLADMMHETNRQQDDDDDDDDDKEEEEEEDDMPSLTRDTPDARVAFLRNMRGWLALYADSKMAFLVRRVSTARGTAMRLSSDGGTVMLECGGLAPRMSRADFLMRYYRAKSLASVSLSSEERLRFYSRLRHTEPEGANILIALDILLTMRGSSNSGPPPPPPLSGDGRRLLRNMACEVRDFDPEKDRMAHFVIANVGARTSNVTCTGALVDPDATTMPDRVAIDEVARLPTEFMWSLVVGNRYLSELEETHPLFFWARVVHTRVPPLYERARAILGENALARFGLPGAEDAAWRNLVPWMSFYLQELFEETIATANVQQRFEYIDLNLVQDHQADRMISYAEFVDASGVAAGLGDLMADGLFLNPYAYDDETFKRMHVINHCVRYVFGSEQQRAAESADFVRYVIMFGNLVLRGPSVPPSGPFSRQPKRMSGNHSHLHGRASAHKDDDTVEADAMLIDNRADHEVNIGGHMFALFAPYAHIDALYKRHASLMDSVCGESGPHRSLALHVDQLAAQMAGGQGDEDAAAAAAAARRVLSSLPVMVGEGTGPQELLLRPLGDYFGQSQELMRRTASHVAASHMMEAWHATKERASGRRGRDWALDSSVDASIYGFQAHLFSDSMLREDPARGAAYQRRLSNFYRRIGHGCSYELHQIDPRFGHLLWVRPEKMRFGANLRHFLEGGDALPLPAPQALSDAYKGEHASRAALRRVAARVIPYALNFPECQETTSSSSSSERAYSISDDMRVSSGAGLRHETQRPVVFHVKADTRLADTIRRVSGKPDVRRWRVLGEATLYVSEPNAQELEIIHSELASRIGANAMTLEKHGPSAPRTLRMRCQRHVEFVICDD